MNFSSPWILLLFLVLPLMVYLMLRRKGTAAVRFASLTELQNCPASWRLRFRPFLAVIRILCLALLIIALAGPRREIELTEISTEGVAIEVVVDHSGSMSTDMDYYGQTMNRLEAVKKVLADFIGGGRNLGGRKGDLIGLVVFARYADTVCPLVIGHDVLLKFLEGTDIVKVQNEDGTAIGDAIALAAARLHKAEEEIQKRRKSLGLSEGQIAEPAEGDFKIKSKVIILLTDGINNTGEYSPLQAAQMAKEWGIKIYTVGIGSGQAFATVQTPFGSYKVPTGQDLDEALLKSIADQTGGFYSRADDAKSLGEIVKKIDESEKTEVKSVQYAQYSEKFGLWALLAMAVLAMEMLASCTIFRKVP